MRIEIGFDPKKREKTLQERGVDFRDAGDVIFTAIAEYEDQRQDYGERRMICFGLLNDRLTMVGYVKRGEIYHIFSMRKANEREQTAYLQ